MPEAHAGEHLPLDELADLAVGEPVDRATSHLAGCPQCQAELAQLSAEMGAVSTGLSDLLGFDPSARGAHRADGWNPSGSAAGAADATGAAAAPDFVAPMPVIVAARLDRVIAAESAARDAGAAPGSAESGGGSGGATRVARPIPLKAPATASYVKQTGTLRIMLAAAMAAAVVGFGGYVVSATAGLNEPSSLSPTQIHPEALASQAESLAQRRDLDAHPFSAAWRCARKVTSGRVTGITPVYVNGEQNYLVYTRSNGVSYANLISGCDSTPTVESRVQLSE